MAAIGFAIKHKRARNQTDSLVSVAWLEPATNGLDLPGEDEKGVYINQTGLYKISLQQINS